MTLYRHSGLRSGYGVREAYHGMRTGAIAVGRPVTRPPPHRSRRAVFSHRALQTDSLPQVGVSHQDGLLWPWPPNHPWAFDLAVLEDVLGAVPVGATSLATPLEPRPQATSGAVKALGQTGRLPVHSVVMVGPTERARPPRTHHAEPQRPVRFPPRRATRQGVPELLARGAACARRCARPILAPMTRTPQQLAPRWGGGGTSPARPPPCRVP